MNAVDMDALKERFKNILIAGMSVGSHSHLRAIVREHWELPDDFMKAYLQDQVPLGCKIVEFKRTMGPDGHYSEATLTYDAGPSPTTITITRQANEQE